MTILLKRAAILPLVVAIIAGCPQAAPVVPPAAQCVSAVIVDALAGLTLAQIVAKDGATCGGDLAQIIAALLNPPAGTQDLSGTQALADVRALQAVLSKTPAPTPAPSSSAQPAATKK